MNATKNVVAVASATTNTTTPSEEGQAGPFHLPEAVGIDAVLAEFPRKLRIARVEMRLDLLEDPLLVLGKRHVHDPFKHPLSG